MVGEGGGNFSEMDWLVLVDIYIRESAKMKGGKSVTNLGYPTPVNPDQPIYDP
jgi:hypothetical protein